MFQFAGFGYFFLNLFLSVPNGYMKFVFEKYISYEVLEKNVFYQKTNFFSTPHKMYVFQNKFHVLSCNTFNKKDITKKKIPKSCKLKYLVSKHKL